MYFDFTMYFGLYMECINVYVGDESRPKFNS